jgi:peptide/nickel transport system ATP-binding protein
MSETLLNVQDLVVEFPAARGKKVHAVSGISFALQKGETLGLVGESGCGKSTTARAVMQLPQPTSGSVNLAGQELIRASSSALRKARRQFQMIFQDPIASLNPPRQVKDIVEAPLIVAGELDAGQRQAKVEEILRAVGLDPATAMDLRPHEFSGGQCQRISIARALILEPDLLTCDEPVSALDVSIQAQILNLLEDMKQAMGLTMLFISHDLAVVKNISNRVAVMYLGRICEIADSKALYASPKHPYTRALLSAIPEPDPERVVKKVALEPGEFPSPIDPPSGCRFRTRCPLATERCAAETPALRRIEPGQQVACHMVV